MTGRPTTGAGDDRHGPTPARSARTGAPWAVGVRLVWGVAVGCLLLVAGTLGGRPDLALLGVAPVVAGLLGARERVRGEVWTDVVPLGSGAGTLRAAVRLAAPPGTEAARIRVHRTGHGHAEALVDVPLTRTVPVRASSVRTGPQELAQVDAQGLGHGGDLTAPVARTGRAGVTVLPRAGTLPGLPLPLRLRGLTGQHGSRRPGEGGELRDVHPWQPGDSLRRVDWRATARRSPRGEELYTRRTFALAEAHVTLVVDSRDDVGPDPATWSGARPVRADDATSLDLARTAAATVAQAYLGAGDRVGLEDLGVRRRTLRAGGGRRQLDRVLHGLAVLRPQGDPVPRVRAPQLPSGTLVWVFSTFLDPEGARAATHWRRSGHRVIAVDVLPPVRRRHLDPRTRLALRLVTLERADRLADLAAAGVELVRWADDDAAVHLQLLSRRSHRRPGAGVGR